MAGYLRQSTSACRYIGPFLNTTDFYTSVSSLSLSASDIRLAKASGSFVNLNSGSLPTWSEHGHYKLILDTTDTNTVGDLLISCCAGGSALPVWDQYVVLAGSIYDAFISSTTYFNGNLTASGLGEVGVKTASSVWTETSRIITGGSVTGGSVIAVSVLDKVNYSLSASGLNEVSVKAASGVWNNVDRIVTGGSISATSGSVVAITVEDKTGYSIAASGIGSTAIGASAINDQSVTDGTRNEISKNLLKFDLSTITGEASRSVLNAIRFLRNKWYITGSTLTVTKENDSTEAWTAELTGDSSACPVIGIDPN